MSLARFLDDAHRAMRIDSSLRVEQALEITRDQWLKDMKLEALVSATLANWTSGNCVEFMLPISEALLLADMQALHRKLWARTIKRQADDAFRSHSHIRALKYSFETLVAIESTDFNEFELHAYDDREKATSFLLKRLMNSLGLWREELMRENLSTREVDEIADCVRVLERPKIQVNSVPQA